MGRIYMQVMAFLSQIVLLAGVSSIALIAPVNAEELNKDPKTGDSANRIALNEMAAMLRASQSKYHGSPAFLPQSPAAPTDAQGTVPQPGLRKVPRANERKARDYRCGYMDGWAAAMTKVRASVTVRRSGTNDGELLVWTGIDRVYVHASGHLMTTSDEYIEGTRDGRERFERFVDKIENEFETKKAEIERAVATHKGYQELVPHYGALLILQSLRSGEDGDVARLGPVDK